MTKTKHTPGPWEIGDEHPDTGQMRILSAKDHVCVMCPEPDDEATPEENARQTKANARLIAAAPDLLDVAKELLADLEVSRSDNDPVILKAKLVIAKATGEA